MSTPTEENWREEFDKKMSQYKKGYGRDIGIGNQNGFWINEEDLDQELMKDFITTLLATQKEELKQKAITTIAEHNAKILNEYQKEYLGSNEKILFVPIGEATKQTLQALNNL